MFIIIWTREGSNRKNGMIKITQKETGMGPVIREPDSRLAGFFLEHQTRQSRPSVTASILSSTRTGDNVVGAFTPYKVGRVSKQAISPPRSSVIYTGLCT